MDKKNKKIKGKEIGIPLTYLFAQKMIAPKFNDIYININDSKMILKRPFYKMISKF